MGKYAEIVNGSWSEATLYAESIPHLLHWDLAYFWVLDREAHLRPAEWNEQIKAWRYLVALLLTDQLDIEIESIREPFLSLTKPYGIEEVSWLKLKHEGKVVGALSPTVLARPLPDYNRGDLRLWEKMLPHPEQSHPEALAHFVKLAVQEFDRSQQNGRSKSSVLPKLARILGREFTSREMNPPPQGRDRQLHILRQISWGQKDFESSVEPITILVGGQGGGGDYNVYIPRCRYCAGALTRSQSVAAIDIHDEGEPFTIVCAKPSCGKANELSLKQFLIWARDQEVVIWDRQDILPVPAEGFPPMPTIAGRVIQFEWQPAQLSNERNARFLRFCFPENKQLIQRKLSELFYRKLLVPGESGGFNGLPFQPEWREAIVNFPDIRPQSDSAGVTYKGIVVRGLPNPINKVYGSLSLKPAPTLGVGIYPHPQIVPDKWKWYRLFLHGEERGQYRLQAAESGRITEILPWLVEFTNGLPEIVSVQSSDNAGVSFYYKPARLSLPSQSAARLHLGVDFGTTNTVIYFLPPGHGESDFDNLLRNPKEHCVEPPRFEDAIHWIAKTNAIFGQPIGDFLPGTDYGEKGAARFIIPTVLWELNDRHLICWDPNHSPPQIASAGNSNLPVNARGNFKLKTEAGLWRQTFLREALLLTLPWVLKRSIDGGAVRTGNLTVSLGFAFPLAFSGPAREEMRASITEMKQKLKECTGLEFETNAVSESAACINLLGSPNSTDTFLVADMGGGTIDLALFTASNPDPDQIGSVQFAGEKFLEIFASKKNIDQLKLGDSIRQGNCLYGGDQTAIVAMRQFMGIAFEFLRTMIASYRQTRPDQMIHLVLAGNGWHLAEVFNGGSASYTARNLFNQYYLHLVKILGDDKLLMSDPLNQLPSSKHLVAVGALKHALKQSFSQLDPDKFAPSRLPAGRSMTFNSAQTGGPNQGGIQVEDKKIEWFDLVGEPVKFTVHSPEALRGMNLSIDFKQMAPLTDPWRSYMLEAVFGAGGEGNIPYPDEMHLRDQIRSEIPMIPVPALGKGPLQLIVEKHWTDWLKK